MLINFENQAFESRSITFLVINSYLSIFIKLDIIIGYPTQKSFISELKRIIKYFERPEKPYLITNFLTIVELLP